MKKIGVLGLWHLGCVYSACLAEKGLKVVGYDVNNKVIENLQKNIPPIFEPGLEGLIKDNLSKDLHFTSNPKLAIANKDYVFITLDTPVNNRDQVLMGSFYALVELVKKYIAPRTVLVICSQVPVGTCRELKRKTPVIYCPENLRLGQAIKNFLEPDRIVLGSDNEKIIDKFLQDFSFFRCQVIKMSLESAEMTKHALNSYLATMISFSSEISDLCELTGANASDVVTALKTDSRVSVNAPLAPGLGFAGGTLGRDLQTLKTVSKKVKYKPKLIKAVYKVNQERLTRLVEKMKKALGSLQGKKIGLLGLTYKPNTNTLRRSQSIEFAVKLQKLGAHVRAIDPAIREKSIKSLEVVQQYAEFFKDLNAVVLMTPWEDFKKLKPTQLGSEMKQKIVFDARSFLDETAYKKEGFNYFSIGK